MVVFQSPYAKFFEKLGAWGKENFLQKVFLPPKVSQRQPLLRIF